MISGHFASPTHATPTPIPALHRRLIQSNKTAQRRKPDGTPTPFGIAVNQPLVTPFPPWAIGLLQKVPLVKPAIVHVLKAAAPVPVGPQNFSARPPKSISAVQQHLPHFLAHPAYCTVFSSQAVTNDVSYWRQGLRFHRNETPNHAFSSDRGTKSASEGPQHLRRG